MLLTGSKHKNSDQKQYTNVSVSVEKRSESKWIGTQDDISVPFIPTYKSIPLKGT